MSKNYLKILSVIVLALVFVSCASTQKPATQNNLLRVGITPDYTPVIFKRDLKVVGIEADLARKLGEELNRPVKFVELGWDSQIPSLLNGKTDIVMSGMSITRARQVRINFSSSYLKSGLLAAMRAEDREEYDSLEKVKTRTSSVGVVEGTTSEAYVRRNFPNVLRVASLTKAGDAPTLLVNGSIDFFVHDAPSIIWLVSENEAELAALWKPLNEEALAWGVRKSDSALLNKVNSVLEKWEKDGTLDQILLKWLPAKYLERIK